MHEPLGIVDLGDVMTETRCAVTAGTWFDFLYGAGRWHC
jgi:hypothetical protein